jgi:D-alanyl-D-alanine dipeptidase
MKQEIMKTKWLIIILCLTVFVVVILVSKRNNDSENIQREPQSQQNQTSNFKPETSNLKLQTSNLKPETSNFKPETSNLVKIRDVDNSILVDLKYATTDNFTGMVLYDGFDGACLQPDVAQMLTEAHRYLKTLHPGLRLLVYDAVRPVSVQRIMWERVKDTPYHRYVAHPDRLSLHNYGAAVDLTLADSLGQPLDMGTPFDYFGRAAGISDEEGLIRQGILNRQQVQNRQLLRQVMRYAGFRSISGEWWHFNACSLQDAKQRYTLIEN